MSHHLESLAGAERRAACDRNDQAMATGAPIGPADLAERVRYATPFEHHTRPSLWRRLKQAVRAALRSAWRWC